MKDLVSGAVVRLATPHPFDDLLRNGGLAINADGSTVAFVTRKAVLTSDTLDNEDVYVWKRSTGMFTRLSVGPLGVQAPNATLAIQGVSAAALAPVVVFSSPFDFLGDGGGLFVVRVP